MFLYIYGSKCTNTVLINVLNLLWTKTQLSLIFVLYVLFLIKIKHSPIERTLKARALFFNVMFIYS